MALSDYDHLAYDQDFAPLPGGFTSPMGISVDLYKNWIYIRDPQAWRDGDGAYVTPTVMEIHAGDLTYLDVSITAIRGPQRGIYVVARSGYDQSFRAMIGIACSGWRRTTWVGVSHACLSFLARWLAKDQCGLPRPLHVLPAQDRLIRASPGDIYLASVLGIEAPATPVGEAEPPLLIQALTKSRL